MATVDLSHEPTPSPARQSPPLVDLVRNGWNDPTVRPLEIGGLLALGLLALLFWQNIQHFFLVWSTDENYSHGFLVPLISLYFANEASRKGPVPIRSGLAGGLSMIAFALAIKLATILVPFPVASDYGLVIALGGTCAVLAGIEALKRYWFAFFFLVFMVPLPVALYSMIANPLQMLVSQVATSMLNVIGIPSLCEGNMITLAGGSQLFVAEACSGMRQLTGFLALTTAWAYLTDRPMWNRFLLVVSSIPIAMTANVVRVTVTGIITYGFDPKYASGAFHTVEGLAMMGLGLLMLATFAWVLDQVTSILTPSLPRTPSITAGEPA
jgi:exosortase